MSHSESRKRRHRGKQRRLRPVRWATFLIGAVAIPIGLLLLAWAARDKNHVPHLFGAIYISVGALSLLLCGLITVYTRSRGKNKSAPAMSPAPSSQSGLALLMALLLMAFLSGVVIQSLMATHMRLRAGGLRRTHLLLRAATLDAAWDCLRNLAGSAQKTIADQTLENRLPSGIATRITVHPMERAALPLPLQRMEPPLFGQYFTVAAEGALGNAAGTARGMACRLPSGEIRILSWWERP